MKNNLFRVMVAIAILCLEIPATAATVAPTISSIVAGPGVTVVNGSGPIVTIGVASPLSNMGPSAWVATTTYLPGSFVLDTSFNSWRAVRQNINDNPTSASCNHNFQAWKPVLIGSSMSIPVPAFADNPVIAMQGLDCALISASATVTINVAHGVYHCSTPISANFPAADRVLIAGDEASPQLCQLEFSGDGIDVLNGHTMYIDGVELIGSGASIGANGVFAQGGFAHGSHLIAANFGVAYHADAGGRIWADQDTAISNYRSFFAENGSYISAASSTSLGPGTHDGYYATEASCLICTNATVSGALFGVSVGDESTVNATGINNSGCTCPWGQNPMTDGGNANNGFIRH